MCAISRESKLRTTFFMPHAKFLYAIRPLPMGILEVF